MAGLLFSASTAVTTSFAAGAMTRAAGIKVFDDMTTYDAQDFLFVYACIVYDFYVNPELWVRERDTCGLEEDNEIHNQAVACIAALFLFLGARFVSTCMEQVDACRSNRIANRID